MALDAATFLSLISAALAVSAALDTLKLGTFWLKITVAILSFLSSLVPLLIKLYVFFRSKQTRKLLIFKAAQKFLLSDYYEEVNFNLWARGMSLYSNIFCENRSFVVTDFHVISKKDNLVDLGKNGQNSAHASHTNEREIDFGYISGSDMRVHRKTLEDDEESRNDYKTERIYFQDEIGQDSIATLILKNFTEGEKYFERGQYFRRGSNKTDILGNWNDEYYSIMYYPARKENTEIGDVRIDAEFDPKSKKLRFRIRNLAFPHGLLTPYVNDATPNDFINSIKVIEYLDEKGWIEWDKKKRRTRRGAHIFHAVNLTQAVIMLRSEEYKLYEVTHMTNNQPIYIE